MSLLQEAVKKIGGVISGERTVGRRSNFFVEKEFQKHFMEFFLVMMMLMIVISGGAYFMILHRTIEEGMYTIHPKITSIRDIITPQLALFFIEVTLIALLIIIIAVDRVLKKVAESLMAYGRIAEYLAKLDFRKAQSIEVERFPTLRRQYRELIATYAADITDLREKMSRIIVLITYLEHSRGASNEDTVTAVKQLSELNDAVGAKLREYKLDAG